MATAPSASNNLAHLQRIAGELRNDIPSRTPIEHDEIAIEKASWPGILHNLEQLREEGMPTYVGNIAFVASLKDLNGDVWESNRAVGAGRVLR